MYKSLKDRFSFLLSVAVVALLALLTTGALWAQETQEEPAQQPAEENALPAFPLFESEFLLPFVKADFNKLVEEAARFIKENPDSHQAKLLLTFLSRYKSRATNFDIFEPVLEAVLEKELENGFNEETYREMLAQFYRRRGLEQKADSTRTFDGYILDCLIIGPFGNSYRACLDVAYEVEKDLLEGKLTPELLKKKYVGTDEFREISWMKYPYDKPVRSPRVSPFTFLRPSGGCAYVLVQVEMPQARPVLIDIEAGSYFKLWLNRTVVLDINGARERQPDSHLVAVNLAKGHNQILVKVPGGSFTLALRDTKGHLIKDLKLERELKIHPVETDSSPLYKGDYNGGALKHYAGLVKERQDDPVARVAYSSVLASRQLHVQALEEAQAALELAPDNLLVAYYVSTRYANAPHYPRALARNKAKELWDRIVKEEPGFVLAHEKIAGYLTEDDKHEKAVKRLRKELLGKGLDNLGTRKQLLQIHSSMKWEREVMAQIKEIEKLCPESEWVYDWWARYYSRHGNPEKAWEFTTKSRELNKSGVWYLNKKASRLEERGKLDEALEIYLEVVRRRPNYYWTIYTIADIYRRQGKYEEAIAQRKKLMEMRPENSSDYETIGDIYREWGKKDLAIEYYRKSLVLDPGQWSLRRYVQYLTGEDEDFSKPYALSDEEVMELIKSAPGKETYPKASNLKVLDEEITKILPNGASASYIHRVYKILDISGKDRHSTPYVGGELIEVRTIQPDGKILEPTSIYGSFTMPSMKEGVCIEYKYRTDSGWGRSTRPDYETRRVYLQDQGYDEPVMKCRRVIIMSKKPAAEKEVDFLAQFGRQPRSVLDFSELKQNKVGGYVKVEGTQEVRHLVEYSKEDKGDTVVYSWSSENMPRIEREHFMPPAQEVLPNAYFISRRTWADFAETLKEQTFVSGTIPTKLIREKAAEIVGSETDQFQQVKALYEWCMKKIKGGWGGAEAHAILLEESGNRDTLFMAFLNVLGIPHDTVLLGPDPFTDPDTDWEIPKSHYFGSSLIRVKPAGHDPVYITMSTRYMPLGKIPESYQGGPLYTPDEGITDRSMPRESLDDIADRQHFAIKLDSLTCEVQLVYPGARSYGRKEYYKDMPTAELKQAMESRANSYFPGALVKSFNLPDLEEVGRLFEMNLTCEVPNFLSPSPKEDGTIMAKTGIQPLEMQQDYADKPTREFAMVLRSRNLSRTRVTIELGEKYEVVQLPTSVNLHNEFGTYVLTFSQEGGTITVKRRFTLLPQRIETDRYEDFLGFCRKIDEVELARIILKQKPEKAPEPENKPKPEDDKPGPEDDPKEK